MLKEEKDDNSQPVPGETAVTIQGEPLRRTEIIGNLQAITTIAKASGTMIAIRFLSVIGGFLTNIMIVQTASNNEETKNYLAASAEIAVLQRSIVGFCVSYLVSESVVLGEHKSEWAAVYQQAGLVGLGLSIPAGTLLYFIAPVLEILGQPHETSVLTQDFFRGFVWSIPAMLMMINQQQLATRLKKLKLVFASGALYTGVTLPMAYLLITGPGPFPALRFRGLGYAHTMGAYTSVFVISLFFGLLPDLRPHRLFVPAFHNAGIILRKLLRYGFAPGVQSISEIVSITGNTMIIGYLFGTTYLAASQIAIQYLFLLLIPIANAATVSSIEISAAIGQERSVHAPEFINGRKLGNAALVLTGGMTLIFSLLSLGIADQLIRPFVDPQDKNNQQIIVLAKPLLWMVNATQIVDGLRLVATAGVRSLPSHETKIALIVSIASNLVVALPLGYLLGTVGSMEASGFFLARLIGIGAIGAPFMLKRWFDQSTRSHEPERENAAPQSWSNWCRQGLTTFKQYICSQSETSPPLQQSLLENRAKQLFL